MWVNDKEMPASYFNEDCMKREYFPEKTLEERCLHAQRAASALHGLLADANAEYKASWAGVRALFRNRVSMRRHPGKWAERLTRYAEAREMYRELVCQYRFTAKVWRLMREHLDGKEDN